LVRTANKKYCNSDAVTTAELGKVTFQRAKALNITLKEERINFLI